MTPAPERLESRRLVGPYRLIREIGRGGQGIVYEAEDTRITRRVALKVLQGVASISEDSLARFRREAEAASRLDHPGICAVHEAALDGQIPYIAMRLVEGESLAAKVASARSDGSADASRSFCLPLSEPPSQPSEGEAPAQDRSPPPSDRTSRAAVTRVVELIERVAHALHAAHEAGVIHRDIKPGNVMITPDGEPVIMDFGLAHLEDDQLPSLTRTGDVFGTPAYMSPEQISGQRVRLDRRTDVYSLGVTLYECLTLRRPFEAPTREGLYQLVMTRSPPDARGFNRGISRDLKVVLETALEKDRGRRYASAEALARDLRAVLESRPIEARPISSVGRFIRWSKREPAKAALLAVLLVAAPTIATLVTSQLKDAPQLEAARLANVERDKDELLAEAGYEVLHDGERKAAALYAGVLGMEGGSAEAAGGLVQAHIALGEPVEALRLLDLHRPLLGDGAAAHMLRASALTALGKNDEASALLKAGPPPQSPFEHQLLAMSDTRKAESGERGGYGRALQHLTTASLLSSAPRLSLFAARAYAAGRAQDRDALVASLAGLRRHWPSSANAHLWAGFSVVVFGDPSLLDDAIVDLREAVRLRPGHARSYVILGIALEHRGLLDESLAAFGEALRLSPGSVEAHANIGAPLARKGRVDEGIAACRKAIAANPRVVVAHINLGMALLTKGLVDDAINSFRDAIRLNPGDSRVHYNLGNALARKGLLDDAIDSLRKAIDWNPRFIQAQVNLACALGQGGRQDEAIAVFHEAIRLGPDNPEAHYGLGIELAEMGLRDEAIAAYQDSIRLKPDHAEAHCNLSRVLAEDGRCRESLAACTRGHELGSRRRNWPYPSADWVSQAQQRVGEEEAREAQLASHLAAGTKPEDVGELVVLARVGLDRAHPAVAARWFQLAFEESPDFADAIDAGHRRVAARAAVLASIGGTDSAPALDDAARSAWRLQALTWLEAEVAGIKTAGRRMKPRDTRIALVPLTRSPDFASVRGSDALAKLPEAERARWTNLWSDIDALLSALDRKPESRTPETRR